MLTAIKLYVQQRRIQSKLVISDRYCEDELSTVELILTLINKEYVNGMDIARGKDTRGLIYLCIDGIQK